MSANAGWLKLHRKLQNSEVFNDPDLLRLWMLCLMKASHSKREVKWNGETIELLPGQFITGRSALYEDYNEGMATKHKVKDTTLWNRLKKLESMGSIEIGNVASRKCSIITLTNWEEHQTEEKVESAEIKIDEVKNEEESDEMKDFINTGAGENGELTPAVTDPKLPKAKKEKRVYVKGDIEYNLASRLFYWMRQNNPKAKEPNPQKWADVIRLMIERDPRDPEDIKAVIDWSQNNTFWRSNILSPEKLRKQFDTLYMQMIAERDKKPNNGSSSRGAKKNDLLREMMKKEALKNGKVGNDATLFLDK